MKIGMACDHAGHDLKEEIKRYLENEGHEVVDFGTNSQEACDLPDHVYPAALAVSHEEVERGIFVDGVGYGSAMIANKGGVCGCMPRPLLCELGSFSFRYKRFMLGWKNYWFSNCSRDCQNVDAYGLSFKC